MSVKSFKVILSRDFLALDVNSKEITKTDFLKALSEGNYISIRLQSEDTIFYYKLFKIEPSSDSSIKASISDIVFDEIQNLKKDGEAFSKFSFKDLNGNLILYLRDLALTSDVKIIPILFIK